jgi:hypothetical protein
VKLQKPLHYGETMRKTIYLIVLLVSLAGSAYAGDMPQPHSSDAAVQGAMNFPLTEIIATALETALSLI